MRRVSQRDLVLLTINELQPTTMHTVRDTLRLDNQIASSILSTLHGRGYLTITYDGSGKRTNNRYSLTALGKERIQDKGLI